MTLDLNALNAAKSAYAETLDNDELGDAAHVVRAYLTALSRAPEAVASIPLTPSEVQSGLTRVKWAEGLIRQLPEDHDGRNSWLLNYGTDATPPAPQQGHPPAADGWMCDGCGRLTKDPKRDFQDLRTLGRVSCCPKRKMLAVKVFPAAPQEGSGE